MCRSARLIFPFLLVAAATPLEVLAQFPQAGQRPEQNRWAVLIGVDDYTELGKLRFAGDDQRALAEQLIACGFPKDQVFLLHDKADQNKYRPFRENIEKQLDLVLSMANRGDLVIVAFSGHGVQLEGRSYFCPVDARLDMLSSTSIRLDSVYERLGNSKAALKLLIVDACRNDVVPAGRRSVALSRSLGEFEGTRESPPEGILLLASCGPGQFSLEDEQFGHGVFMHFVLEALQGKATDGGHLSLASLYDYASLQTKKHVAHKFNEYQTPSLKGEINGPFEIGPVSLERNKTPVAASQTDYDEGEATRKETAEFPKPPSSIDSTNQPVGADAALQPGQILQVEQYKVWWAGRILAVLPDGNVKVHYIGWSNSWDEAVPRTRLQFDPDAMIKAKKSLVPPPTSTVSSLPGVVAPGNSPVTASTVLSIGDAVRVEWNHTWWAGEVLGLPPDGSVKIHYVGWDAKYDEIVSRSRLRLPAGK